jgi:N-methylhydantoinase B/oxoprolinase/acetone carboxylase alpha subunit
MPSSEHSEAKKTFTWADFLDPLTPEEEVTVESFKAKLAALDTQARELRTLIDHHKVDLKSVVEEAVQEFRKRCEKVMPLTEIQRVVHEKFEAEGQEMAKAIFTAILKKLSRT